MSEELDRLKIKVGLVKFVLGTVILGIITAVINFQIQNREIDLKEKEIELKDKEITLKDRDIERLELDQLGKYIEHALVANVAVRRRFAQYFSKVTGSDKLRARWQEYYETVDQEYRDLTDHAKTLEEQAITLAQNEDNAEELRIVQAQLDATLSELEVANRSLAISGDLLTTVQSITPLNGDLEEKVTAWTSWIDTGRRAGNPCPTEFEIGKVLSQKSRVVGFPPRPQYKYEFECVKNN